MSNLTVLRGLNNSGLPDLIPNTSPVRVAWSNVDFLASPPNGSDPITLILRLLMSTGRGTNYPGSPAPNYDVYEAGIGLGIPFGQVDIDSFLAVKGQNDYDLNQQLFFLLLEPESAREFIEAELCRPFGIYLRTGNDGKIRCVRPRHPQKIYVGDTNRRVSVRYPATTGNVYTAELPIGVFDGTTMGGVLGARLQDLIRVNYPTMTVTGSYSSVESGKFTLAMSGPFDLINSPDLGWMTLGWTAPDPNKSTSTANATRAVFSGVTLSEKDMWSLEVLDNEADRITAVTYSYDYDAEAKTYNSNRTYSAADVWLSIGEVVDTLGPRSYSIHSRGLISAGSASASWVDHWRAPTTGCIPVRVPPSAPVGINADTWSKLFALSLIDRYQERPLKVRAKLKWAWNHLEIGDVVKVNHGIPGVLFDAQRKLDTITNRLFEIVELRPDFHGCVEVTLLSHRWVSGGV